MMNFQQVMEELKKHEYETNMNFWLKLGTTYYDVRSISISYQDKKKDITLEAEGSE